MLDNDGSKDHAQREAKAGELRGRIVRAERWDQLFPSPDIEMADFIRRIIEVQSMMDPRN